MRIGELSHRSGLSRDTLRHYERAGLIRSDPGAEVSNSYRDYPETALMTLELVADAQAAGMTLADVVTFLGQLEAADVEAFDGVAFLEERISEVEGRLQRTRRFLKALKAARAALISAP